MPLMDDLRIAARPGEGHRPSFEHLIPVSAPGLPAWGDPTNADAAVFAEMVRVLYLAVFTQTDPSQPTAVLTLLQPQLESRWRALLKTPLVDPGFRDLRQRAQAEQWLRPAALLPVAELQRMAARLGYVKAPEADLLTTLLATRGDTPVRAEGVRIYTPLMDGGLTDAFLPGPVVVSAMDRPADLPPYWRWVWAVCGHADTIADGEGGVDLALRLIAKTALPLCPFIFTRPSKITGLIEIPFANYVSLMLFEGQLYSRYETRRVVFQDEEDFLVLARSRFFGNSDYRIADLSCAQMLVKTLLDRGAEFDPKGFFDSVFQDQLFRPAQLRYRPPAMVDLAQRQVPAFEAAKAEEDDEDPHEGEGDPNPALEGEDGDEPKKGKDKGKDDEDADKKKGKKADGEEEEGKDKKPGKSKDGAKDEDEPKKDGDKSKDKDKGGKATLSPNLDDDDPSVPDIPAEPDPAEDPEADPLAEPDPEAAADPEGEPTTPDPSVAPEEDPEADPAGDPLADPETDPDLGADPLGDPMGDPADPATADPELPGNDDNTMDPGADPATADGVDNSMSLISLDREGETVNDLLYRSAVLATCDAIERNPDSGFPPDKLEVLRDWCNRWLFVASTDATKQLVNKLGLTATLRQIAEKK